MELSGCFLSFGGAPGKPPTKICDSAWSSSLTRPLGMGHEDASVAFFRTYPFEFCTICVENSLRYV